MNAANPESLALQRLYHWERTSPDRIALSQPMVDGVIQDFTWSQVAEQVRRMAAHLKAHAPVFDAGRRAFPIFSKANNITGVQWTAMDPPLRETMLVRGDIDAITGFTFTSLLNLEARGVKAEDVVVLPYPDYGVKLYGNAIIASPKMLKENPAAVKAFLVAFAKGMKDVMANPAAAIADVKARDGIVNVELETRRLKLAIDTVINSPNARAEGFGQINGPRLSLMASQVSDAFNTKSRVNPDVVWNGSFLPTKAELNVLTAKK